MSSLGSLGGTSFKSVGSLSSFESLQPGEEGLGLKNEEVHSPHEDREIVPSVITDIVCTNC